MLLRRMTQHVKDQNWFAVGLDFVIVVAGILIAFQITNWSAARQDNLIYEQARVRVIEEASANLLLARDAIKRVGDQQNQILEIIQDLETCSPKDGAQERLMGAMLALRYIVSLEVRLDAIKQILTSDAFLDNISPEDRATLSVYARLVETIANNSRFSDDFQLGRSPPQDNPIFKRTLDGDFESGFAELALMVSYEEACQNTALSQFLFDRLENGTYILGLANSLELSSREVLIGLGEGPSQVEPTP